MENKWNVTKTKDYLEIIYYLCEIFSGSIYAAICTLSAHFGGIAVCLLFVFAGIQIIYSFVIPNHKKISQEVQWEPSFLVTIILWIVIIVLMCYIFVVPKSAEAANNETNDAEDHKQKISIEIYTEDDIMSNINITIEESSVTNNLNSSSQTQDDIIESYILRSNQEEISISELRLLSDDMLYLIRNGIFAYCGLYYPSGYYNRFEWYNAVIMSKSKFDWNLFNTYQVHNINNIKKIEMKERHNSN